MTLRVAFHFIKLEINLYDEWHTQIIVLFGSLQFSAIYFERFTFLVKFY